MPLTPEQRAMLDTEIEGTKPGDFPYFKAVLFGEYGVGKSTISGCFGKTLFYAADPGYMSVYNHTGMDIHPLLYGGYNHFEAMTIAIKENAGIRGEKDFDTVVIDTIDEITHDVVDSILIGFERGKGDDRPEFIQKNGGRSVDARRSLPKFEIPGRTDYHAMRNLLRGPLRRLMLSPVNVIILSHEREPTEEEARKKDAILEMRPSVSAGVYKTIANHTHLLGHFTRDGDERKLTFARTKKRAGKSRIAKLDGQTIPVEWFPKAIAEWQGLPLDHYVTDLTPKHRQ